MIIDDEKAAKFVGGEISVEEFRIYLDRELLYQDARTSRMKLIRGIEKLTKELRELEAEAGSSPGQRG